MFSSGYRGGYAVRTKSKAASIYSIAVNGHQGVRLFDMPVMPVAILCDETEGVETNYLAAA